MFKWKWTKDELACPELTRKYADKLWHFSMSWVLVMSISILFKFTPYVSFLISVAGGILWEYLVDIIILDTGASKLDLLADLAGSLLGGLVLFLGK